MCKSLHFSLILTLIALAACGSRHASNTAEPATKPESKPSAPVFDADSAYAFVAAQTAFGPRVPGTDAHRQCADWLSAKLESYGGVVTLQRVDLQAWDNKTLPACNISASFNPDANKRILLLSHWDSRPWADHDPDPSRHDTPIDGANDGASGVGVILEIARAISVQKPSVGVDVLFVDAEDYGTRADKPDLVDDEGSWCLGTQYWIDNPTLDLGKIRYAILLDMVGGKDAVFPKEYFSQRYSPAITKKVWKAANDAGFGSRFIDSTGGPIIDDHIYLLKAGIDAIDIIECANPQTGSFNPTWHTHADNIDNIDRESLHSVGQTLINLIYSE